MDIGILQSVDQQFFIPLRAHKTAKSKWDYLETIYKQDNSARRFQLELELSEFCQWKKSIQEFRSGFISLWTEFVELVYATVPESELPTLQKFHKSSQRDQFLMKLRNEFESVH